MKNFKIDTIATPVRYFIMLCLLTFTAMQSASANDSAPTVKVGSNVLAAVAFGDANLTFEKALNDLISITASTHYIFSTELLPTEAQGLRGSIGLRAYQRARMEGIFVEFKTGLNYYKEPEENALAENTLSPSFEVFAGYSSMYNDMMFYEAKIGAMRVLSTGKVVPAIGFSTGLKF